ncbi:MAG: DUF3846 domain-containing protein [Candidatus Ventricola sp.]
MRILIVAPDCHPRMAEIPHTLEAMQQTVGGYIEITYPWKDPIALVCDEEGILKQLPFNRLVAPQSAIFGTFFLCGIGEEDLTDIPEELADKYMRLLYAPERLIRTSAGYAALPVTVCDPPRVI